MLHWLDISTRTSLILKTYLGSHTLSRITHYKHIYHLFIEYGDSQGLNQRVQGYILPPIHQFARPICTPNSYTQFTYLIPRPIYISKAKLHT